MATAKVNPSSKLLHEIESRHNRKLQHIIMMFFSSAGWQGGIKRAREDVRMCMKRLDRPAFNCLQANPIQVVKDLERARSPEEAMRIIRNANQEDICR